MVNESRGAARHTLSRIFISHSSKNDDVAIALQMWFVREGWSGENDIFLDLDPDRGIAAGERWRQALEAAATRCEAVLFLVSEAWLASKWCYDEYQLAAKLDKKVFALLIEEIALERLPGGLSAQWQVVHVRGEPAERFIAVHPFTQHQSPVHLAAAGLTSLKRGLEKAGVGAETFVLLPDPAGPFGWRAPYRGLEALEPEDAAVFFGRSADIMRGMDALRGLAGRPPPRLLVILGASGAGKSSFLRAGLWPRLARDDTQWLPLRAIRAGRGGAIEGAEGLLAALEELHRRFALRMSRADLRQRIATPEAFVVLLRHLRQAAARRALLTEPPFPLPVLCLDQAEEVFAADAGAESESLLRLCRAAIDADAALLLATIRSDAYGRMQNAKVLTRVAQTPSSLGPVPSGEVARIIREPAEILRRKAGPSAPIFDPAVVARLQEEVAGEADALPLLAFVLQRLMREHEAAGTIGLEELEATGGVAEAIEWAAEAALADAGFGPERGERREALRRLFIPRLARVDRDSKAFQRRIARQADLPPDLLPLAQALTERRLLVVKALAQVAAGTAAPDNPPLHAGEAGDGAAALEVAHEALLRRWPTLAELLTEDRDALLLLDGVLTAAADWQKAAADKKPDYLAHRGSRLADAQALAPRGPDWAREIAPARAYLAACAAREAAEREEKEAALKREQEQIARTRKLQRRVGWALAAIAMLIVTAVGLVSWQYSANLKLAASLKTDGYQLQHRRANLLAELADTEVLRKSFDEALRFAVAGTRVDGALPAGIVTASPAAAELAATAWQSQWRLVLSGHAGAVNSAAFSPDGTRIVTASADKTARIWDAATGKQLAVLRGHQGAVNSAAFSPDGKHIVTASADKTVRIWDAETGKELMVLHGGAQMSSAAFSPDSSRIVTASWDGTARIWDAATGEQLTVLRGHTLTVWSAAFSPDGRRIVTASLDGTARIWDAATGKQLLVLREPAKAVQSAAFSPDGTRIVTAGWDKTARIWDAATGKQLMVLSGHTGMVWSAAFSPDSTRVVTASLDGTARIWDAATGEQLMVLHGHTGFVLRAAFSPDGTRIVTASDDKTARIWRWTEGAGSRGWIGAEIESVTQEIAKAQGLKTAAGVFIVKPLLGGPGARAGLLPGDVITSVDHRPVQDADQLLNWIGDMAPGAPVALDLVRHGEEEHLTVTLGRRPATPGEQLLVLRGHTDDVESAVFSPDGKRIVTASLDGTARIWDAATGKQLVVLRGHTGYMYSAAFSPDGKRIVTASGDGIVPPADNTVRIWDAATGKQLMVLRGHTGEVRSAAFSPDGKRIVSASDDKTVRIWDAATGKQLMVLRGHTKGVNSTAFSPDGKRIVTASWDGTARIWDAATGRQLMALRVPGISSAAFSPDGKRIVTGALDGTARIWDAATGKELVVLRGHTEDVESAAFSPDGRRIVTASHDKTARIWDVLTGKELVVLPTMYPVSFAAFSPNGRRLVTTSVGYLNVGSDNTARVWDVHFATMPTNDLIQEVCTRRLRGISTMTRDEMRLAGYPDSAPLIDVCSGVR
jgi:WD40 repeat protein